MVQTTRPTTLIAGRYALEEELERSATGIVWVANDISLRRRVTLTLVHPRLADDPEFVRALGEQIRRVAQIADPRLARLLDSGEQDGVSFVVREHVEGASLHARLKTEGPPNTEEAARIVCEVLDGLATAHAAGALDPALHLDDVILATDGRVVVTDLGIGSAIVAARPDAVALLGRDGLAPELGQGRPADERTDVFAAGALLFEVLTGEPPGGRTSPRRVRGDVPRAIDRATARALDPDPGVRFPDARSFALALRADREIDGPVVHPEAPRPGLLSWLGVPLLIAGVAVAVIALGLWVGSLEVGGPLGVRPAREAPEPGPVTLRTQRPASAVAIDPFGDDTELSANAPRAIDGDLATSWRSEDYFDGTLGKPGIGLVLDLGATRRILGLRLWTAHPGYSFQVAVGDDPATLLEAVGEPTTAGSLTRVDLDARARYVLVWITSVVPTADGNRAEVAEVRVVVPASEETGG